MVRSDLYILHIYFIFNFLLRFQRRRVLISVASLMIA